MSSLSLSRLQSRQIDRLDAVSRRVFFRADLNVPMMDGGITDTTRIDRCGEGIRMLAEKGARVIVASHFGRPRGKRVEGMSLAPIADALAKSIGRPVRFVSDCIGSEAENIALSMADGDVILLENLRFHPGEEQGDADFAASLARLAEIYVNDAFSTSHRNHASMQALARLLPAYAGPLMAGELAALAAALEEPQRPLVALVGGAKVSTKLDVLSHLVEKVDSLIVGGGMANTFLLARGVAIGSSLVEADMTDKAAAISRRAGEAGCSIILPDDVVLAREFAAGAACRTLSLNTTEKADAISDDEMILDAGPSTIERAKAAIDTARTLIWNGPMGAFELEPFDAATVALARHVAERTRTNGLISVAGGGDTVSALNTAGVEGDFHYVSTAGGAFLEWMEGKTLPGVAALLDDAS